MVLDHLFGDNNPSRMESSATIGRLTRDHEAPREGLKPEA
jgi:hypothetical protein